VNETFDRGDVVVITHTVTVDGVPVDPSTIVLRLLPPSGVEMQVAYAGGTGQVVRDAPGVYTYQINATESGRWLWRWETTGVAQEAEEDWFKVRRSKFP
jgi:hypothetical protein